MGCMTTTTLAATALRVRPTGAAALHPTIRALVRWTRRPSAETSMSVTLAGLVFVGYALVAGRLQRSMAQGVDLTIFHQGVRALSRGEAPWSAVKGSLLWGDHFHPAIAALAPLYWLWDDPQVLVLAQAGLLGLGTGMLARTAMTVLVPAWGRPAGVTTAIVLATSLALSPGVQGALTFDFHEVALGVPLLAGACAAVVRGRWRQLPWWSLALLTVKEDMGLLVVGLGMTCFARGQRLLGAGLAATGLLWTGVVIAVVIPALSPTGTWTYGSTLGGGPRLTATMANAWFGPQHLLTTMLVLVLAAGGLCVRSPLALALLPTLLARGISTNPAMWGLSFHYNLLPGVVLAFATLDVLRHCRTGLARATAVTLLVLGCLVLVERGQLMRWAAARPDPAQRERAGQVLTLVPPGASVMVDAHLTPLAARGHVHTQLLTPALSGPRGGFAGADYVVLDRESVAEGNQQNRWEERALPQLLANGYRVVKDDGRFVLLGR